MDNYCGKYVGHAQYLLKKWLLKNGYLETEPKKHKGDELLTFWREDEVTTQPFFNNNSTKINVRHLKLSFLGWNKIEHSNWYTFTPGGRQ